MSALPDAGVAHTIAIFPIGRHGRYEGRIGARSSQRALELWNLGHRNVAELPSGAIVSMAGIASGATSAQFSELTGTLKSVTIHGRIPTKEYGPNVDTFKLPSTEIEAVRSAAHPDDVKLADEIAAKITADLKRELERISIVKGT